MAHTDSFIINIAIADIHRLTAINLYVSNAFQNINFLIHKRVCIIPPTYYLDWFERYYPNITINKDDDPFCLQCMNVIQGTKPAGRHWNRLLDAVVTILKYKK